MSLGSQSLGRLEVPRRPASQDTWPARGRLFSARETPRGAPMSFLLPRRLAAAFRPFHLSMFLFLLTAVAARAAAADLVGEVVDSTGRALPRAYVRLLAESGAPVAGGFTDERGRFVLAGPVPTHVGTGQRASR